MRKKKQDPDAGFAGGAPGQNRITPADIQQREFRLSVRGYNEREVDQFLDELTEEVSLLIEEKRQLSERLAGDGGAAEEGPAPVEADRILADAREEADRIVASARTEAGGDGGPPDGGANPPLDSTDEAAVRRFLSKEREFLQGLAGLIQNHAETVKAMARSTHQQRVAQRATAPPPAQEVLEEAAAPAEEDRAEDQVHDVSPAEPPVQPIPPPRASILGAPQMPHVPPAGEPPETQTSEASDAPEAPDAGRIPDRADQGERPGENEGDEGDEEPDRVTIMEEPEASSVRREPPRSEDSDRDEGSDRSLRDLFWSDE